MVGSPGVAPDRDRYLASLPERLGPSWLEALGGAFTALVPEEGGRALSVYTDRFGMQPLFVHGAPEGLWISSKVCLLAACLDRELPWNTLYLAQVMLFNYPLGEETFLDGVRSLPPATRLRAGGGEIREERYGSAEALLGGTDLRGDDAVDACEEALRVAVRRRLPAGGTTCLSLTGGFDGRTLLALFPREEPLLTYTFGTPDSLDVTIAARIASGLGVAHLPVLLDGEYHRTSAVARGVDAVVSTEGRSTFRRAQYAHAASVLKDRGHTLLTGNFGSELLNPVHETGEMLHPTFRDLVLSDEPEMRIADICRSGRIPFVHQTVQRGLTERLIDSWRTGWTGRFPNASLAEKTFLFMATDVFRKYFGPELEMESPHIPNHTPFLDEEFLAALCKGPFAAYRRPPFRGNPVANRKNQELYARILRRTGELLYRTPTARGYPPCRVVEPLGLARLAPSYVWRRFFARHRGDLAMGQLEESFYSGISFSLGWEALDYDALALSVRPGSWAGRALDASKAFSLALWHDRFTRGR
jgi:hypothetical protein